MAQARAERLERMASNTRAILSYVVNTIPEARDHEDVFLNGGAHPDHLPKIYQEVPEQEAVGGGGTQPHEYMPKGSLYRALANNEDFLVNCNPPTTQEKDKLLRSHIKTIRKRYEEICRGEKTGLVVARRSTTHLPVSLHGIPHIAHYFIHQLPLLMNREFPFNKATFHDVSYSRFAMRSMDSLGTW